RRRDRPGAAAGRPVRRPGRPAPGARRRLHAVRIGVRGARAVPLAAGLPVAMSVLGLGSGLLDVAPAAVVGDVVEGRGGPVFAAYSMSSDVANVIGPVSAGALAAVSYSDAFALTAAILFIAVLAGCLMPETK